MKQFSQKLFDKFIDGTANLEEQMVVKDAMRKDRSLQRIYIIAKRYDAMMEEDRRASCVLPIERMAAETQDNLCDIICERYILRQKFPGYGNSMLSAAKDEQLFLEEASDEGVPLYRVGYVMEKYGLVVQRQYGADIGDIQRYLKRGDSLIAVVDEDILKNTNLDNKLHTVCVLGVKKGIVTVYNPSMENEEASTLEDYPVDLFVKAWEPSERYLVRASTPGDKVYEPHPINLDGIDIDDDLNELIEPIAENLHDVWAQDKLQQGVRYGPLDENGYEQPGFNHYLVPFSQMPDHEKQKDIISARQTLKLLKRLGFSIVKNNRSENFFCPDCEHPIELTMSFCPHCGRKLQVDDYINHETLSEVTNNQ